MDDETRAKLKSRCSRKIFFPTRRNAQKTKKRFHRRFGTAYSSYKCPVCSGYHLTTNPRERRAQIEPREAFVKTEEEVLEEI